MADKSTAVSVELKNGVVLQGKLASVDKFMNFNLYDLNVDVDKWPQFVVDFHQATLKTCFIRGSTVRYVHLPAAEVDTDLVEDAFKRARETNN